MVRKKLGLALVSEKTGTDRVYRIAVKNPVRKSKGMRSRQLMGRRASKCKGNGPISPSAAVRAARGSGSRPRRQPGFPERGKSAKIRATSGVIREIPP